MNNDNTRCSGRERITYLNIIAEKDKAISDIKFECQRKLAEKDKIIQYYAKHDALATERKKQAIRNADRRAKLNFSYAALILVGMAVIPWFFWFADTALREFWLLANGR